MLSEWVEVPAGIVAQIMGHKPSAITEKHYIQRELDLLHLWHVKIEAWILEQAGIEFNQADIEHGLHIDHGPGYRVYYAQAGKKVLLLLVGGDKNKQQSDINKAISYWKDWNRRTQNE